MSPSGHRTARPHALVVPPGPIGEPPYRIAFVCTGNICRSPMAEVITRTLAGATSLADGSTLADHLEVTSAGTGPWHEGEPMHPLARTALIRAGYPDHGHVAHQVVSAHRGTFAVKPSCLCCSRLLTLTTTPSVFNGRSFLRCSQCLM